jgi:hypothetical protein
MSPIARALHTRFEEVCRSEVQRLTKKTASLAPEQRAEVERASAAILDAMAGRLAAAIDESHDTAVASMLERLFDLQVARDPMPAPRLSAGALAPEAVLAIG